MSVLARRREQGARRRKRRKGGNDPLSLYLNEVGDHRLLTAEEEIALARRIQSGDDQARKTLARHNLCLVISIAGRYSPSFLEPSDLVQEGNYGLLIAVDRYDPDRGHRFSTYAGYWIHKHILQAIYRTNSAIRYPDRIPGEMRRWREVEARRGGVLSDEEIATEAGISMARLQLFRSGVPYVVGAQGVEGHASGERLEEKILDMVASEELEAAVDKLDVEARLMVKMYYGFGAARPHSQREIAEYLDCGHDRVGRVLRAAYAKLRQELQESSFTVA